MLLISFTPPSVESSELVLKLIVVMLNYLETGAIIIVCCQNHGKIILDLGKPSFNPLLVKAFLVPLFRSLS